MKPLAIDLCCGLGGWTDGLLAEGYDVIGFDIEKHEYGDQKYPGILCIQDVRTLHGSQFKDAALIVASPPCQFFSYTAMPWKRAKALAATVRADPKRLAKELEIFNACVRIGREANCPVVIENVRGAIPWIGKSRFNFGSFHLWGDVPALMPIGKPIKVQSFRFDGSGKSFQSASVAETSGRRTAPGNGVRFTSRDCGIENRWFNDGQRGPDSISSSSSSSPRRKAASAMIAKIPLPLSRHIARVYHP